MADVHIDGVAFLVGNFREAELEVAPIGSGASRNDKLLASADQSNHPFAVFRVLKDGQNFIQRRAVQWIRGQAGNDNLIQLLGNVIRIQDDRLIIAAAADPPGP